MSEPDDIHSSPGPEHIGPRNLSDSRDLLARIYERQRSENEQIDRISNEQVRAFARIDAKFEALDSKYVSQVEFWPVKMIVYIGAGTILLAVLGALIAMVVISREAIHTSKIDFRSSGSTLTEWIP